MILKNRPQDIVLQQDADIYVCLAPAATTSHRASTHRCRRQQTSQPRRHCLQRQQTRRRCCRRHRHGGHARDGRRYHRHCCRQQPLQHSVMTLLDCCPATLLVQAQSGVQALGNICTWCKLTAQGRANEFTNSSACISIQGDQLLTDTGGCWQCACRLLRVVMQSLDALTS